MIPRPPEPMPRPDDPGPHAIDGLDLVEEVNRYARHRDRLETLNILGWSAASAVLSSAFTILLAHWM